MGLCEAHGVFFVLIAIFKPLARQIDETLVQPDLGPRLATVRMDIFSWCSGIQSEIARQGARQQRAAETNSFLTSQSLSHVSGTGRTTGPEITQRLCEGLA